ncbi:MAG: NrfD/PsrC family molybdoenzyme membrane anchor subunit [Terriglobales bacterium]
MTNGKFLGSEEPKRVPDSASERRLSELRDEADQRGVVSGAGVRPAGSPFPRASEETGYYGIHLLKQPQWTWEIPLYFFVGGASGASAVIGAMADWIGDDYELAKHARWVATAGSGVSSALLISDLGRPARFLHMLRIIKPQSAMSVGAWTLAAFGSFTAASTFAKLVQERWDFLPVKIVADLAQFASAVAGLPFHNYTGVLIGATVIPAWNKNIETLPIHFGMSGVQSACSILELLGHHDSRALNILGLLATGFETYEGFHLETRAERELRPLKRGVSGWITRAGGMLSGPVPLVLRLASMFTGSKRTRRAAAISGITGSILTRYGWMSAGKASARDWKLPLEIPDTETAETKPLKETVVEKISSEKLA